MSKRPHLIIDDISGSNSVKASVINKGSENAINVTWEITIEGCIFNVINAVSKGNFTCIGCNCAEIIHSGPFSGFGLVKISIMADAQNAERTSKRSLGLILDNYIVIF